MVTSKAFSKTLVVSCLSAIAVSVPVVWADTTSIGLLNPLLLPQQQGWTVYESGEGQASDVTANGAFITSNTIGIQVPTGGVDAAKRLFHRQIPILVQEGYAVDFWLKVNEVQVPHNEYDAGVSFFGSTISPLLGLPGVARAQMIYFDEDGIGWGDDSGSYAVDTTDDFHHYRFEVDSAGNARVLVDGELALERADFSVYPRVAFGDYTNGSGLNSRFSVSSVTVTGLVTTPVPVDIRPSDCPNVGINGRSTQSVPIAIVGTADFNVEQIDPASVRINKLAPKGWAVRDATRPNAPYLGKTELSQCASYGAADGRKDLVVAFEARSLAREVAWPVAPNTPLPVRVTGKLKPEFGGGAFAGEDVVVFYNLPTP